MRRSLLAYHLLYTWLKYVTHSMLGWENFLLGFVADEFTTMQEQAYYDYMYLGGSGQTG